MGELLVELLVDAASGNLSVRQMVAALGDLDVASAAAVGTFGKITEHLWEMAKTATATSVELTTLAEITHSDPAIVLKWERAAARMHISAQSIVGAIMSVDKIQRDVESNKGVPGWMGAYGIEPWKGRSADGKTMLYKDLFDYVREFSAKGSTYQTTLSEKRQQDLLANMFGGNGDSIFRLIKDVSEGKVRLSDVRGLDNKQIGALNKVDADWISVKQDVTGLFERFLTGGEMVDQILVGAKNLLEAINKILDMPSVRKAMGYTGRGFEIVLGGLAQTLQHPGFLMGEQVGANSEDAWARAMANKYRGIAPAAAPTEAKHTLNLEVNGKPAGQVTFADSAVTRQSLKVMVDGDGWQ